MDCSYSSLADISASRKTIVFQWLRTWALFFLLFSTSTALQSLHKRKYEVCDLNTKDLTKEYPTQYIQFPVDHFHNESRYEPHSSATFTNRYWFDDSYYKPGGPVIVVNGGEDNGAYYLDEIHVGLPGILAKATNGIAVVLEHRYYGNSFPVRPADPSSYLTDEEYRFLSVEQAMADEAFFAKNARFLGKEGENITLDNTPFFAIGCSYPGGLTAFQRIQYPDVYWGAISSSGVTVPKFEFYEWYDAVRDYSPPDCAAPMQKIISVADKILLSGNETQIRQLKSVFGTLGQMDNTDFAAELFYYYEPYLHNWVSCLNADDPMFCNVLSSTKLEYPQLAKDESTVKEIIANGGWANETNSLTISFLNLVGLEKRLLTGNNTMDREFVSDLISRSPSGDEAHSLPKPPEAESYEYQQCTEFGWFMSAGGPQWPLPIVSSLVTADYLFNLQCKGSFNITTPPKHTNDLLKYGGYNLSYPRLMLVGGEKDPWRTITPLATRDTPTRLNTTSTPDEPWFLIENGAHCWDWPGIAAQNDKPGFPPKAVNDAHKAQIEAIQRWTKEWHEAHPGRYSTSMIEN